MENTQLDMFDEVEATTEWSCIYLGGGTEFQLSEEGEH